MKNMVAKIDKEKLEKVLREELMTYTMLAKKTGINRQWLSSLASKNDKYKASINTCKKILSAFEKERSFEDIFFWLN